MDLKQLRNFVAVADHKSFTRAAEAVNLSQPALSVSIRKLEQELDTALFVRTTKTILITDAGSDFLVHARAALREVEKAEEIVNASKSSRRQTVRIGVSSFFANIIAREVIGKFCHENPGISVEVEIMTQPTGAAIDKITSGKWDFALLLGHVESLAAEHGKEINIEPCTELTTVVHARKQHPLAKMSNASLSDLAKFPWVISTLTRGHGITSFFTEANIEPPDIIARVNTLDFIVAMVESQDLLTILPTGIVGRYSGTSLIQLPNSDIRFRPAAIVLDSKELTLTPAARRLKNRIQKLMASLQDIEQRPSLIA